MTPRQKDQVRLILEVLAVSEAHHGDCLGADADFHKLVQEVSFTKGLNATIVVHPPSNSKYRAYLKGQEEYSPMPYLERDRDIVDDTQILVATPDGPEKQRSGTWYTVRYARNLERPILVVYPDGTRSST